MSNPPAHCATEPTFAGWPIGILSVSNLSRCRRLVWYLTFFFALACGFLLLPPLQGSSKPLLPAYLSSTYCTCVPRATSLLPVAVAPAATPQPQIRQHGQPPHTRLLHRKPCTPPALCNSWSSCTFLACLWPQALSEIMVRLFVFLPLIILQYQVESEPLCF